MAQGNGDISLFIYDELGHLVAQDAAYDTSPVCLWRPQKTQVYIIKVVNNEDCRIDYELKIH